MRNSIQEIFWQLNFCANSTPDCAQHAYNNNEVCTYIIFIKTTLLGEKQNLKNYRYYTNYISIS